MPTAPALLKTRRILRIFAYKAFCCTCPQKNNNATETPQITPAGRAEFAQCRRVFFTLL